MIVNLVTGVVALIYALNIPVRVALTLEMGKENRIKIGVGLFNAAWIVEKQLTLAGLFEKKGPGMPKAALTSAGKFLMRSAKFSGAKLLMVVGTGDAMQTALLCGVVDMCVRAADTALRLHIRSRVAPCFERPMLLLSAGGILTFSLGHIIHAAILLGMKTIRGKLLHGSSSD